MVSINASFRDAEDPTCSSNTSRYLASDFQRLTNRRTSSPPSTPDFAHEPLHAECSNDDRTVSSADKRAIKTTPAPDFMREAQASRQNSAIRKGSWSSVKEEEGGKLQNPPRLTHLFTHPLPKNISLTSIMRSGIAQSFLESVNASAGTSPETGHDAGSPTGSGICDCCCRCGRSPKWQPLGPGRKRRSKSYTALRTGISELSGWDLELPRRQEPLDTEAPKHFGSGEAPIERLPVEVLGKFPWSYACNTPLTL